MYGLEIYHRVRRAVLRDGMSERAAALAFGVDRGTISKMLTFSEPPGYRLKSQRPRSRMDAHAEFVDQILISDREVPKKQRHTVRRIFERLRDERGFEGGYPHLPVSAVAATNPADYMVSMAPELPSSWAPEHPAS